MLKSLLIWSWLVQIVQADLVPNWQPADGDPIPYGDNTAAPIISYAAVLD